LFNWVEFVLSKGERKKEGEEGKKGGEEKEREKRGGK